ncbi:hypothetical protein [Streptomyces sp. CB03911]|uniref:hypothetical protein n=1 Tax=Streptomycetaceae TaxID=2062 RepID=UPI00095CFC88|nr:hypothetical protein [Streptomyces sp. CB03911]OKI25071.1 hypothetical protein A6A07_31225 [Streptomyces sp. CB03911]
MDAATLDFSTQDLLLRSSPALYLPAGVLLCVSLLAVTGYHLATRTMRSGTEGRRIVRRACWAVAVVVGSLLVLGFLAGFEVIDSGPMGTPLLIGGALLVVVLARLMAVRAGGAPYPLAGERAALGICVALIVLCSFWAAAGFAHQKGTADARWLADNLALRPAVVLDTTERLYLQWPGVEERTLPDAGAGQRFRYRYRGVRLLAQANNRMFLIPRDWTWEDGNVLILPVDASVRIAFHPG